MAKRISELTAATAVAGTDEFEVNQGGASRKATRTQIVSGLASVTHAHTLGDITDAGALAALDTVGTGQIDDGALTPAKLDRVYSESGHTHADATGAAAGFMSGADKNKLDGVEAGAQVNRTLASQAEAEAGADNIKGMTPLRTAQAIAAQAAPSIHQHELAEITDAGALAALDTVGTGQIDDAAVTPAKLDRVYSESGHTHADATGAAAGFMAAADKNKLDAIEAGAQVNRTLASQAEAEAGTDNVKGMTPLRTAQAIAAQAAPSIHQHELADVTDVGALAALDTAGTAQIEDDAVTAGKLAHGTADRLLGFDASGAPAEISAGSGVSISNGTISATGGGGEGAPTGAPYLVLANDADLTNERTLVAAEGLAGADGGPNGSYSLSIAEGGVTNAKLAAMAQRRFKGRASAGSGTPEDLTAAQAWSVLSAPATLTFGATVSWDVGAAPIAKLMLSGNCTINASNVPEGQAAVLILHQDATGGRSVTWGTGFSGADPVYALGGNGVSALYFGGTATGLVMTQVLRASQAEAEAGTTHARLMTPLRTAQAIAAQAAPAVHQHLLADVNDAGALAALDTVGTGQIDDDAVTPAKLDRVYSETGHTHADATGGAAGFMSAADKSKLDGIEAGAQVNRTLASQTEAEAGTDNVKGMTPLRTAQAIAAKAAPAVHQHALADVSDAGALAAKDTVGTADLDDDAVTTAKLAHGPADSLLGFNASGAPAAVTVGAGIDLAGATVTAAVTSVFGRTGGIVAQAGDYDGLALNLEDAQLIRPEIRDYSETAPTPAIGSGALTLDLESGNVFDVVLTEDITTITVVNPPASGKLGSLTVRFRQDAIGGRTVDLSGFDWGSAGPPTVPAAASTGRLWLMALTLDGGASWDAMTGFGAS